MYRNDEVMVGRRKETKSRKIAYLFGYCVNFLEFTRKWIPENLIFQLHPKKISTNNGPIEMFVTKKCNYISLERRWNHPFLSQSQ